MMETHLIAKCNKNQKPNEDFFAFLSFYMNIYWSLRVFKKYKRAEALSN